MPSILSRLTFSYRPRCKSYFFQPLFPTEHDGRHRRCNGTQWTFAIVDRALYIPPAGILIVYSRSAKHSTENRPSSVLCHASTCFIQIESVLRAHFSPFSRSSRHKCRECPSLPWGMYSHSRCNVHTLSDPESTGIQWIRRPGVWLLGAPVYPFRADVYWVSSSSS